jgi:uncharacterized protein (TIGR03000 family)
MFSQLMFRAALAGALAIVALAPSPAQAQRYFRVGPVSFYSSPYYYSPWYGYYSYPDYYSYRWYSYPTYSPPAVLTESPRYGPAPATNSYQSFYPSEQAPAPATLNSRVPANAELWLQGAKMNQTGEQRKIVTPALSPDRNFMYDVRARWNDNGQEMDWTRHVRVRGGEEVTVDFLAAPPAPRQLDNTKQEALPPPEKPNGIKVPPVPVP